MNTPYYCSGFSPCRKSIPETCALSCALIASLAFVVNVSSLHAELSVTDGLVAHLDATNVDGSNNATLANGNAVNSWTNLVSSDHAALIGGSDVPTFVTGAVNGNATIRFDGNDALRFGSLSQNQLIDTTIFIVSSANSSASSGFALSSNSNGSMRNNITTGTFGPSPAWTYAHKISAPTPNSQFAVTAGRSSDFDRFRVVGARFNDPGLDDSGADQELFVAGDSFSNTLGAGTQISQSNQLIQLGARGSAPQNFFTGDISEVLIYDKALTEGERQQVELYLGQKYNTAISPGLKLYHSYDGDDLSDQGSGRSGTIEANGSASGTFVDGVSGRAIQLQQDAAANGSRVQPVVFSDELNFTSDDWTISSWVQREADGTRDQDFVFHIGRGDGFGGEDELYLFWNTNSDSLQLQHYKSGSPSGSFDVDLTLGTVEAGDWAHFAIVHEGGEIRAFLDGVEVASDLDFLLAMDQSNNDARLTIGGVNNTNYNRSLDGSLDETAVWSRALSDFEVQGLFSDTSPLFTVVPEPASAAALFGIAALGAATRRRCRS